MSQPVDKPSSPIISVKHPDRPTVGFFVPTVTIATHKSLWTGAFDAALAGDANLIICPGQTLGAKNNYDALANILYDIVGKAQVDGLVAWPSGIGIEIGQEASSRFFERYRPLPMVNIGMRIGDIPCLMLDNTSGIRQIVQHLVEVHGCRRLAFIHGQKDHIDDEERYRAYLDALREFQLPIDPNLETPHHSWFKDTGERAIAFLLDQRQAQFDGIVAGNDWLAIGAIQELERRGIEVPRDISVIGFTDAPESRVGLPPITTVSSQFYERGRKAVELLLKNIRGEPIARETLLPVQLTVRQSCGCQLPSVKLAAARASANPVDISSLAGREALIAEIVKVLGEEEVVLSSARQWIESLAAVLTGEKPTDFFLHAVDRALRRGSAAGFPALRWQDGISLLRRGVAASLEGETLRLAEDLWHQASVMIADAQSLTREAELMQGDIQAQPLRELAQRLITTFEMDDLINILAESLPRLGIPSFYLSLYEDPQQPTQWARLMLAHNDNGRVALPSEGLRFPTQELVPPEWWPQGRPYCYIAEPLYFRQQSLGFALFEIGPKDGNIYELLRREISSALQGAVLVQRLQKHSAELARQNYILDSFMENIPDLIYFKDLESRFTRINQAHATYFGLANPAEAIGKSDFDYFSEEDARSRYNQEQQLIATDQPLLRLEETDHEGRWCQTTKMPLRDEKGHVIGTFGLSRDISDIKKTQAALERAYNEVEKQVEQRTAELRQEITERTQIEKRLRQIVERLNALTFALPDLVFVFDWEGRYLEVVETHQDLLYHPPSGQVLGNLISDVMPKDVAENFLIAIRNTIRTSQLHSLEYELDVPVGKRWFEGRIVPLSGGQDSTGKVVWLARDITQRKQAEEEQKRLIAELEAKNAELEQFTYTVSHDLKAPLITIRGFLGYVEKDMLAGNAERLQTDMKRIYEATAKMQRLLNELLELSRVGRLVNPPEMVPFRLVVQDAVELVRGRIDAGGVQIEVAADLPTVYGDRSRLVEVLQNLLDNACKFMGTQPEPRIEIGQRGLDADEKAVLFVRDNGIGIEVQYHERIFGLFNKLDAQTDGTGVGLALVKRIIEVHGGRIWVESQLGKGTTFYFTLGEIPKVA
jgi:PAS domain S-box-containing protein